MEGGGKGREWATGAATRTGDGWERKIPAPRVAGCDRGVIAAHIEMHPIRVGAHRHGYVSVMVGDGPRKVKRRPIVRRRAGGKLMVECMRVCVCASVCWCACIVHAKRARRRHTAASGLMVRHRCGASAPCVRIKSARVTLMIRPRM